MESDEIQAPQEEVRPSAVMIRPEMPSQAEIDKHRIDHLPYRSWCPECVKGFGRERAHQAHSSEVRSIQLVPHDYMYLTRSGVFARNELPEGD